MRTLPILLLMLSSLACVPARAVPACHAASASLTLPLVELYTSEGCDSCPPADRWLSSRFGGTRAHAVALGFHVDYWDRLGWVDRFASHAYTERQYQAMRANGGRFVYTPQVLLQGRDFGGWRGDEASALEAAARQPARATIALDAIPGQRDVVAAVDARVPDASLARDAQLYIAYEDSSLVSDVKSGENRGVRLTHDHVVRTLRLAAAAAGDGHLQARITLPKPAEAGSHPEVVAFVQRASNGDVLQALALPLSACPGD